MFKRGIILFILFFSLTGAASLAETTNESVEPVYTKEFSIFSGSASGELKHQDDYEIIPLHIQFGFDITKFFNKINLRPKGSFKFILEPFLNTITSPDANIEVGNDFILKYAHPITKRFFVYLECGLGMMFTSQHTNEQSTQFNFTDQAGGGFSYFFSKNKAVNLGYRYRHFSNASIQQPNDGIDMDYYLCGFTILY